MEEEKNIKEEIKEKKCNCKDKDYQIEALKKRVIELENKIKLIQADNINFRRRKEEEVANILKYANEDIILEIINELDNFYLAFKDLKETEENKFYLTGFRMILKNFENLLVKNEVSRLKSLDDEFNYNLHEAIAIEKNEEKDNNIITEVFKEGYMYKDKVIRHAQVKVNQKGGENE